MEMKKKIGVCFATIIMAIILIAGCTDQNTSNNNGKDDEQTQVGDITITSSVFINGDNIPVKYSCDGDDISPPLSFSNIPEGAQSLVLILDDPDAPGDEPWVHWMVYRIPSDTTSSEEDAFSQSYIGKNSWDTIGYGGPCPPIGETHRYYFRLYALDIDLDLSDGATRQEVDDAMEGHILGQTSLMGKYSA
jgi:Raf kinase inhibitor-like YbhB/YbcL family protein